jgi:hypothetical protein
MIFVVDGLRRHACAGRAKAAFQLLAYFLACSAMASIASA